MAIAKRVGREWLLVAEMVVLGLFAAGDASGVIKTLIGKDLNPGGVVVASILVIGSTALVRLGHLREKIDDLEADVRVTARLGEISFNVPDPGPDRTRLIAHIHWEIWTDRDVIATDKLALNLIHLYDKPWWKFWKQTRFAQTGIPRVGYTTEYREKIYNNMLMPFRGEADFDYTTDRGGEDEVHWLLELALVTGVPARTYRVPIVPIWSDRTSAINPPL